MVPSFQHIFRERTGSLQQRVIPTGKISISVILAFADSTLFEIVLKPQHTLRSVSVNSGSVLNIKYDMQYNFRSWCCIAQHSTLWITHYVASAILIYYIIYPKVNKLQILLVV